jgi:proteic killer suppression protein
MILSFRCPDTERLSQREWVKKFKLIERTPLRKLVQIEAATELRDLTSPPGNRLQALRGSRKGQHSIRINDEWRVCFVWKDGNALQVEIVDYH